MDEREPPRDAPPPRPRRGLRRAGAVALAILVAAAGVIGLLLFLGGRDHSNVDHPDTATGPGQLYPDQGHAHLRPGERPAKPYASDPPTSGPHVPRAIRSDAPGTRLTDDQILHALELGDVVVLYGGARPAAALTKLADTLAGPFDPALAATGQAIVLGRRAGAAPAGGARTDPTGSGVIALAWRHLLRVSSASDPALATFASYWLGRGADDG